MLFHGQSIMATEFERKETSGGLTFKLYRGEGVALLAFDLTEGQATDDFVGFSVEVKYPDSDHWGALKNRLSFDLPPANELGRVFPSTEAPFQKFRWIHVPTEVKPGEFRYRVTARYMDAAGVLRAGDAVENAIAGLPTELIWLTYRDVEKRFGVSRSTTARRLKQGLVPGIRFQHDRMLDDGPVRRLDRHQLRAPFLLEGGDFIFDTCRWPGGCATKRPEGPAHQHLFGLKGAFRCPATINGRKSSVLRVSLMPRKGRRSPS
jgi:hypothetical protein